MSATQVQRPDVPEDLEALALARLRDLLDKRLRYRGRGAFVGAHEVMGIVEEEVREAWDATHRNKADDLVKELLDVAVGCIHGCASLWALGKADPGTFSGLTAEGDHGR